MGEGDNRTSKRSVRLDSRELARVSKQHVPTEAEWDARFAPRSPGDRAVISRTATVDDPLTTSLLAEVARRSRTVEVSPDQIDEAIDVTATDAAAAGPDPADDPE